MPHKDPEARRAWRQAYHRAHYEKNKEYYAEKRDRQKARLRRMVSAWLRHQRCSGCRDAQAGPLRIVHGAEQVAHGIAWGWGPERLMGELQRCVVCCDRCAARWERQAWAA